ncbi:MAG: hypothetical protein IJL20_01045 [Lachnospiraceae bacterium]|nr:hypothetical protein [Lachnospiraceae bacterium]
MASQGANYNYTKSLVVVHGKSEYDLVRYIYTNLHLNIKIIAKDKGRESIQINGLKTLFAKGSFLSLSKFSKEYGIEYDKKNKVLKDFKLFVIMDTDDCSQETKNKYISGELFEFSVLKDYIIPIYNIENLEDVMIKAGIMTKRIPISQKGSFYSKVFPVNTEPKSLDTINQVTGFYNKIKNLKETNLKVFVEYCYNKATGLELK